MIPGFKRGEGRKYNGFFILAGAVASSLLLLGLLTTTAVGTAQAIGIKKIEVTSGGYGIWQCARMVSPSDYSFGDLNKLQLQLSATKNTQNGLLQGTWTMIQGQNSVGTGTITKGVAAGDTFVLTGTATSNSVCSTDPIAVVITGKCGTHVGVAFSGQKFEGAAGITTSAAFGNVTVACT